MRKTLLLSLNKYPTIPHSLRFSATVNSPVPSVEVDLANLYHHYFLDSFGTAPPNPDPAQFEHVQFLLPTSDFRFHGRGLGIAPAIKKHRSNELGQAFCRWFLHEHFNITYFAHMEHIIERQLHRAFEGCRIERAKSGDTPDYFCAEDVNRVFLAEAKGRYSSISFTNKEFTRWREQFDRVIFKDATGSPRSIKGHIVATRFATEKDSLKLLSGIWAEDPDSPGEQHANGETIMELGAAVVSSHYSTLMRKLGQPILSAALSTGVPLSEELGINCVAWRVVAGPLKDLRFIGGYYGSDASVQYLRDKTGRVIIGNNDPLRINNPPISFFGVEESIFRQVVHLARTSPPFSARVEKFEQTENFYSGFSVLRDGSALSPVEFFTPDEQLTL